VQENAKTSAVQQCVSATGLHLLQNKDYANISDQKFSIFYRAKSTFHLLALEASYTNSQTHSLSSERIRLLIANFILVGVHPTLTIFHFCSSSSSPATSTNQRDPLINQSAPFTPQPISVDLFQRHLHL